MATNASILAAFERMWQHIVVRLGDKADAVHTHDDKYYTESEIDSKLNNKADSSHTHTKSDIGLGNVDNTADANKTVKHASTADSTTKSAQDAAGNVITTTYETKSDATAKLTEAKTYADSAAADVKNDLLNGAGSAYDTLKELGELIDDNADAINALETVAASKANASDLTSHTGNKSNPHGVTKSQVGLGNVPNVATNDQTPTYTAASTLTTLTSGEKLSVSMGKIMKAISDLISHIGNKSNPHGVTLAQLGVNATATELNYVDGVTSSIQTQLDGKAASSHKHNASDINAGTLSLDRLPTVTIAKGGTGATTAEAARTNLSVYSKAEVDALIAEVIDSITKIQMVTWEVDD